jgi:hypothetical protein
LQVTVVGIMNRLRSMGVDVDQLWRKIEQMVVRTFGGAAHNTTTEPSGYCHNKLYGLDVMLDSEVLCRIHDAVALR